MSDFDKNFDLNTNDVTIIKKYFLAYNFILLQENSDHLLFIKKDTFLSGWILNPLNWQSAITVNLASNNNDTYQIRYVVKDNGYISPTAFSNLFDSFITNLNVSLNNKTDYRNSNNQAIKTSKYSMIKYLMVLIFGTLLGFILGGLISKTLNIPYINYFGLVVGFVLAKKAVNQYVKKSNN